jgi:hypothetical protein
MFTLVTTRLPSGNQILDMEKFFRIETAMPNLLSGVNWAHNVSRVKQGYNNVKNLDLNRY